MDKTSLGAEVCSGESRGYVTMNGTFDDYRALWKELDSAPDKGRYGSHVLSNEEEWMLWLMWPRKSQKVIARALHMCSDTAKMHHDRLVAQNGPKGERPVWMK